MATINLQPRYGHTGSSLNVIIKCICNEIKMFLLIRCPSHKFSICKYKSYIKSHTFAILNHEIDFFVTATSSFFIKEVG